MRARGSRRSRDTSGVDLGRYHVGVIHVHSRYSHDGRESVADIADGLRDRSIDFCVLTDHFEDFDPEAFRNYLREIETVNDGHSTLIVPAVEVNVDGFDLLVFPAKS